MNAQLYALKRHHGLRCLIFMCMITLLIQPYPVLGQEEEDPFTGRNTTPIRLNFIRLTNLGPNSQTPPYGWSAAYLGNAFRELNAGSEIYLQDSSVCALGIPNTKEFDDKVKVFYSYNNNAQVSEIIYQKIQAGGSYENYSRKRYSYQDGEQASYSYQLYDAMTQSWKDDYQETSTFDEEGRIIRLVSQEANAAGILENLDRADVQYDENGNPNQLLGFSWENGEWLNEFRQGTQFNDDGEYKQITLQDWIDGNWKTIARETANYDGNGSFWRDYQLEILDTDTDELQPLMKEEYFYNDRGFWSATLLSIADSVSGELRPQIRERYNYTRRGLWISWRQQIWEDGDWVNALQQEFEGNRNTRFEVLQVFDEDSENWIGGFRNFTRFDDEGNMIVEGGSQFFNPLTNDWINLADTRKCEHSWSTFTATTANKDNIPGLDCMVLNPYRTNTPINCNGMDQGLPYDLSLIDIQGRKVLQKSVRGGSSFTIDRPLGTGIYQMSLRRNNRLQHIQKIMIR